MSAVALTFSFIACDNKGGVDLDNVTEDGFYVAGAAAGTDVLTPSYMMSAGVNEVLMDPEGEYKKSWSESKRAGMYEKYIVLEANKDFELLYYSNGEQIRYGASLAEYPIEGVEEEYGVVRRGELKIGKDAPAMQVPETGLYHIVLDLNVEGDLAYGKQIIVAPVTWGVRGGMNGWGFTAFPAPTSVSNNGITWVLENQKMSAGAAFKFAYNGLWKIQLDDAGKVKAHTNLGLDAVNGAGDIAVDNGGLYKITLTYKLAAGDISASYEYNVECTEESAVPTECYLTGGQFGSWFGGDTENPSPYETVKFNAVPEAEGHFWAVRYFEAGKEFKLSTTESWDGELKNLKYADGSEVGGGNLKFETSGLYIVYVDLVKFVLYMEEASIYGIGDAFGGWTADVEENKYTVAADGKVSATVSAAGNMRTYVSAPAALTEHTNWWKREFVVVDGKITYRGNGGDPTAVALTIGQTITLDFNAGTGSIQ